MFIKPNEFEYLLAGRTQPPSTPSDPGRANLRIVVGSLFLALLLPLTLMWLGAVAIAIAGTFALRALRGALRFAGQAAEHAGLLIVG